MGEGAVAKSGVKEVKVEEESLRGVKLDPNPLSMISISSSIGSR